MTNQESRDDQLTWRDIQDHLLWWLRQGYGLVHFFAHSGRRHPLASLLSAGIFAAVFTGLLHQRTQEYQVTSTLVYGELHPKIFGDMIGRLNSLIDQGDTGKVTRLLALSPAEVGKIKEIRISDIKGKSLSTNYTMRKEPMLISLTLSAPMPDDTLYRAITHYLNSNPFTADRLEMKKRQLRQELAYLETKLMTIDSILTNLYASPSEKPGGQSSITIENAEGKNAHELLNLSRELLGRKMEIENNLINPENVFAIDNFLVYPKAIWSVGSVTVYLLAGALTGYLLVVGYSLWRDYLKKLVAQD